MSDPFAKVWNDQMQKDLIGTKKKSTHVSTTKITIKTSDPFMPHKDESTEASRKKHKAQKTRAFRRSMRTTKKKHGRNV